MIVTCVVVIVGLGGFGLLDRLFDGLLDLVHTLLHRAVLVPTTLFASAMWQKYSFTLRASSRSDGLKRVVRTAAADF